jgi:surface antigen
LTAVALGASFALAAPTVVLTGGPAAATPGVDDYPSKLKTARQDSLVDPWRFYNRECTSFVAWRLNNDNHVKFTNHYLGPHWGDAAIWKAAAIDSKVRVDAVPVVGSVAWWGRGSAGSSVGHVAWVLKVNSSASITVEEYNYLRRGFYDTRTISITAAAWPEAFIHVSDLAMSNTKVPLVSGTPRVGVPLTALAGFWTPTGATYSYQWYAGGTAISGATSKTFTPTPTQLGKAITVRVTATKAGVRSASATTPATAPVAPGIFTTSAAPAISGTAQVGRPLTATPGTWSPAATFGYQWLADGVPVPGATSTTFTPSAAQMHKAITVRVTAAAAGYTTTAVTSAATAAVAPGTFAQVQAPTVSGTPQVDHALTATAGRWAPAGATAYQWLVDGVPVAGATRSTYTPTASQVGWQVATRVTVTAAGYDPLVVVTPANGRVAPGTFTKKASPTVSGSARVDATLAATTGSWSPTGTYHYQWLADGQPISGATASTLRLGQAQVGKRIAVRVLVSRPGYTGAYADSAATAPVVDQSRFGSVPRITGSAQVGATLRVVPGAYTPSTAVPTYQWWRGHTAIRGATGATYRATTADVGKKLWVQATLAPAGWAPTSTHSYATGVVRAVPRIAVHSTRHGRKVDLRVAVTAAGVSRVGGTVVVREGSTVLRRLHLVKGHDTGSFRLARRGVHHLTISYQGGSKVVPLSRTWTVRIR